MDDGVQDQPGAVTVDGRPLVGRRVVRLGWALGVFEQLFDAVVDLPLRLGRKRGVLLARICSQRAVYRATYAWARSTVGPSAQPLSSPARARVTRSCSAELSGFARIAAIPHQRSSTTSAGRRSSRCPASSSAWRNCSSNTGHSCGANCARAARTAGLERSILVGMVVTLAVVAAWW